MKASSSALSFKVGLGVEGCEMSRILPFEAQHCTWPCFIWPTILATQKCYCICHSHADRSGENASLAPSVTRELG